MNRIPKKARIALGYVILFPLLLLFIVADRVERGAADVLDWADRTGEWLGDVVADVLRLEAE